MQSDAVITLLVRCPPYGSSRARAVLDMALAAAVFEQPVRLVFLDDGVFQLLPGQQSEHISAKNTSAALTALPLYGIETVYVHQNSLQIRDLRAENLLIPVQTINDTQLKELIASSSAVMNL